MAVKTEGGGINCGKREWRDLASSRQSEIEKVQADPAKLSAQGQGRYYGCRYSAADDITRQTSEIYSGCPVRQPASNSRSSRGKECRLSGGLGGVMADPGGGSGDGGSPVSRLVEEREGVGTASNTHFSLLAVWTHRDSLLHFIKLSCRDVDTLPSSYKRRGNCQREGPVDGGIWPKLPTTQDVNHHVTGEKDRDSSKTVEDMLKPAERRLL
ncbi:hypothetical protein Q5P01_023656 [Channa striata]|uniref:Uncharacterized protein n=1 Tax=Channa striata TaxID=64152 RepID=A0AA88LQJ2_CHASR|nr:hypothetical protein Q5P01_023656 [Channa striata]